MSTDLARWYPGDHHVLAWAGGAAILRETVEEADAERIWNTLRRESTIAGFLESLTEIEGASLLQLPWFAVALLDEEGCHLAVRGEFRIMAGDEELSGAGVTTWVERWIARPQRLALLAEDLVGSGRPIVEGIVSGGALAVGEHVTSAVSVVSAVKASRSEASVESEPSAEAEQDPHVEPEPQVEAEPEVHSQPVAREELREVETRHDEVDLSVPDPHSEATPESESADEAENADEASGVDKPAAVPAPAQTPSKYSSLFGASIAVSAEDAAVREESDNERSPASERESLPAHQIVVPWGASNAEQASPAVAEQSSSAGSRDLSNSRSPEPTPPIPQTDLHDGHTVLDPDELDDLPDAPPANAAPDVAAGGAPMVLASFCQRGHANPPQRSTCRVCDASVESRTERTPRPALGRVRLSSGELVELVGPVIAGRSPTGVGFRGSEQPRLLALPHPHVSSNHIEFTLEGWTVMVRDLQSRNGSYLRRSGKPPVRLPESAIPIMSGDIIDLGHGVFLYLEHLP